MNEWPAHLSESRKLSALTPYARNSRKHSDEQVAQISASMLEFGFVQPVLIDEKGMIIAGHGRVLAAQRLVDAGHGEFDDVPVIVAMGWRAAKKAAYVIIDNKLTDNSGFDEEILANELKSLANDDFDMSLLGFDDEELNRLLNEAGIVDEEGDGDGSSTFEDELDGLVLRFADRTAPMSQYEVDRLGDLHDRYLNEHADGHGFVAWLLDGAHGA